MIGQEDKDEIWSNFFLVKNKLMDYNENFNDAVAVGRMMLKAGYQPESKAFKEQMARAHRHVILVFNLAMNSLAIPKEAKQEEIDKIIRICKGNWNKIDDFEYCQDRFREWFRTTGLYDITVKIRRDRTPL
jgi:predicted metal-dependent TIM-barrel fold hydrolase